MAEEEIVIELKNVSKVYRLFGNKADRMKEALHPFKKKYHKEFYALNDINLQVKKGEVLGIVGMNGSGKSTLLKIIAGIIQPTSGSVKVKGNVVPLLELGAGFNPEFTGLENIYFYNSILGFSRKETEALVPKILEFAEIGEFIHQPIKTYSSGMRARLSFAVSVNINPDILIIDEILSVGDDLFRRKSFARIEEFFKAGKTVLFVSHSEGNVNQLCSRAIMLHQGKVVLRGMTKIVTMNYARFLFSNVEKRKLLLEDFAKGLKHDQMPHEKPSSKTETPTTLNESEKSINSKDKPCFLPNFIPKSTVITQNARLKVSNISLQTLAGQPVNVLCQHEDYIVTFKVDFFEETGFINFGIGFKTERGVDIAWKLFPGKMKYLSEFFHSGDSAIIKWQFSCLFMPGTYFINMGIRKSLPDDQVLLFKGADLIAFRVLGNNKDMGGVFDTNLSFDVQIRSC